MDRKSILILVSCFTLLLFLPQVVNRIFPPIPLPPGSTNRVAMATSAPTNAGSTSSSATVTAGAASAISSAPATPPDARLVVHGEIPEETISFTNQFAIYTFTSRGGGIRDAHLLNYPENAGHRGKAAIHSQLASLNEGADTPILSIIGDDSLQGDGVYKLTRLNDGVKAEKILANGLVIAKEFHSSSNYLVRASIELRNKTAQAITIPTYEVIAGTSTPMSPEDNGFGQTVLSFNGSKTASADIMYFNTNTSSFFGLVSRIPKTQYLAGNNDTVWLSTQNQYFLAATIPDKPPQSLEVRMVALPELNAEEIKEYPTANRHPNGLKAGMVYPGVKLESGQTLTNGYNLYIGPKEYQTLSTLAVKFNNDFDLVMNFGWLAPVSKALLLAMNWMHGISNAAYGWLIIVLTIALKLIFWPITRASTRSAKKMQALQPQLKAMQEKYKDDPQKLTAKQWEFYKENKVNPLSGCLPMLLQIPVFIGFYWMLRTAIELRGAHFLWMSDLSKSDTLFSVPLPFHLLGFTDAYFPINPMPLLLGVTQIWQASLMPMSPNMDESQQKMMRYMPLMALLFMYSQPSGLALYWTVSNLLSILQTRLTKTEDVPAKSSPATITVTPRKIKK